MRISQHFSPHHTTPAYIGWVHQEIKPPRMTLLFPSLLGRIVAMLIKNTHSPAAAFQKYLDENPWSLAARMYDV